jgi:uncharacterized protein YukE
MALPSSKGDLGKNNSLADTIELVHSLQQSIQSSDARLKQVEEAGKVFSEVQDKMDVKMDAIQRLLMQLNTADPSSG